MPDKVFFAYVVRFSIVVFLMEIFEHVREVDCYHNIFIAYPVLFTMCHGRIGRKKLLEVEFIEKLFKVNNDS